MPISKQLFGPFTQILTMRGLPDAGPIRDDQMEILTSAAIVTEGDRITDVGNYKDLNKRIDPRETQIHELNENLILLPGLIDAHTHICHAGSRHEEYAKRLAGVSYLEISKQGGGIMDTVRHTRNAALARLTESLAFRCDALIANGVTTCEVKSGYGLTVRDELKMLQAIRFVREHHPIDLVATALPAHVCPPEYENPMDYLELMIRELLPEIRRQDLADRVDIYVDKGAFTTEHAKIYLKAAGDLGFQVTVHADQFSPGGSRMAASFQAVSADHLEVSGQQEIRMLAGQKITGTVLPGASMGLGLPFAPARKMIDAGMAVAIASDWNPGSAPMGDLMLQACVLGAYEKLSMAETLAGITIRAARALGLKDRGEIGAGKLADMIAFSCDDYRQLLYRQGVMKPVYVWKEGKQVK